MIHPDSIVLRADRVESHDPATGQVWAEFESSTDESVREAVRMARLAGSAWAERSVKERAAILQAFRRLVVDRRNEIATVLSHETGKPVTEALFEIFGAAELAHYYSKIAPRSLKSRTFRSSNLAVWRKRVTIEMEPYGVLGLITPWNYPFLLASGLVLPALVAGNGVVLKPSELTPSISNLLRDLLVESGLPDGALRIVQGSGETGGALIGSGVDKVFFIGSEATGRKVALAAAKAMKPYVLELGGSDPAIVLEDAHISTAAEGIAWGRFTNAGQTCVAPKRVFVVDEIYDQFLDHLSTVVQQLQIGRDGQIGPLIRPIQRERLMDQLEDALQKGARVAARSRGAEDPSYFPPTVLVDVAPGMRVLEEETFGPLLPVVRVKDADEAIERANATTFGLSASIWSRDVERASRLARRIEAGSVTINDSVIVALLADMPYGGIKASGTGRTHGEAGLLECVRSRSIVADRFARFRETYWHFYGGDNRSGFENFLVSTHGRGLIRRILAAALAIRALYIAPAFRRSRRRPSGRD